MKVTVLTVTYGNRFAYLSQVIRRVMEDTSVTKLIIVDNGSHNKEAIHNEASKYGERVIILREEKNIGSAGGFAKGLLAACATECDYVLMLDDDNVPEKGFVDIFSQTLATFGGKKVVLCGNRFQLQGNEEVFYTPPPYKTTSTGTFFDVISFSKARRFFELFKKDTQVVRGPLTPSIPNESFAYGGTLLPIEAVRKAELPDPSLVLYGDDIEYSWNVKKLGYESYVCISPKIADVDLTFGSSSHIKGLFDPQTKSFKVYYRIRNMVRLSLKHSKQMKVVLVTNILVWVTGLCIIGIASQGIGKLFWKRAYLIMRAVIAGFYLNASIPAEAVLP
jgi:GT2 family glycosyltransferase